ncbi:RNaseH domain-containing protein [Crocosphaera sp.]|uniref:RNaseH domain-containing protein n=1 Tax=Crocosphaera sp. TaxID=2729996 RepID=UPI003F2407D1|nr:RNaseH domain-containing protein [Crocosphaera sp.]
MVYQTISALALKLKADLQPQPYYGLQVNNSEEALQYLKLLTAQRNRQSVDKTNIPFQSLYQALRLLPGLIHINQLSSYSGNYLVYSPPLKTIDRRYITAIRAIINYWIELEFPDNPTTKKKQGITAEERENAKSFFFENNLVWSEKNITFNNQLQTHPNGTANLVNDDFILLSYILAAELTKPECTFTVDGQPLKFYRTTSRKYQPIELISWNPIKATIGEEIYYYSIVLTIKVETVPHQSYPEIHIKYSIRRWLSMTNSQLSHSHSSNAFILADLQWRDVVNPNNFSQCFVSYPMKMYKQTIDGERQWIPNWENQNRITQLLRQLNTLSATPQEILSNPENYLTSNSKEPLGVAFKEGMTPQHQVGKGLPSLNVKELYEQITNIEFINSHFDTISYQREKYKTSGQSQQYFDLAKPQKNFDEPVVKQKPETEKQFEARKKRFIKTQETELKKCKHKKRESDEEYKLRKQQLIEEQKKDLEALTPKSEEDRKTEFIAEQKKFKQKQEQWQAELRTAIVDSGINNLTLWLWYIKDDNLKNRLKAIQYCLGIPQLEDGIYSFDEGLKINIKTQEMGGIADRLEFNNKKTTNNGKPTKEQIIEATNKRITQINEIVQANTESIVEHTAVWVELEGEQYYKFTKKKYSPWCDPKNAIKLGFAKLGFVSKFITPQRKSYKHKAITSLIELLRQLGVRIAPSNIQLSNVDSSISINEVALWLVNKTGESTINNQSLILPVIVRMVSDSQQIEAIFPGRNEWIPYHEALTKINDAESWKNDDKGKKRVRTFIQQTLKTKELRNKPTILYCKAENIRSAWSWLQDTQISNEGLSFGERDKLLFEEFKDLRVIRLRNSETPEYFATNGEKGSGFTRGLFKKEKSKYVFYSSSGKSNQMSGYYDSDSKIQNPEKSWGHPSLLEITIAYHQPEDNLTELAAIAHESRKGILQYADCLEVPRILHYAKQINEYVLIANETENEDEEN